MEPAAGASTSPRALLSFDGGSGLSPRGDGLEGVVSE